MTIVKVHTTYLVTLFSMMFTTLCTMQSQYKQQQQAATLLALSKKKSNDIENKE